MNLNRCKNIPITIRKVRNGKFLNSKEIFICNIGHKIANSIIAGYYKGIDGDNRNAVLVEFYK